MSLIPGAVDNQITPSNKSEIQTTTANRTPSDLLGTICESTKQSPQEKAHGTYSASRSSCIFSPHVGCTGPAACRWAGSHQSRQSPPPSPPLLLSSRPSLRALKPARNRKKEAASRAASSIVPGNYFLKRRRIAPAVPAKPVASSTNDDGSGVATGPKSNVVTVSAG
jgi:hypothetical protein